MFADGLSVHIQCGVIEVIPRSMSRDMMGREKVNSLYE